LVVDDDYTLVDFFVIVFGWLWLGGYNWDFDDVFIECEFVWMKRLYPSLNLSLVR
jgi:hypothetical protein